MKAAVITRPGGPEVFEIQDRPVPAPSAHEVLIKVLAAGINRPDVLQRKGKYPPPPGAPADIPGLEVAGIIEKTGSQVSEWKAGDRVCALISGGGYAEYAVAHEEHCLPVPENLDFHAAASLPETVFTVWHNVFRLGDLKKGEHFLVHGGTSGIGITAIQLAKSLGAKVFTTAGSDDKCRACVHVGADEAINYNKNDFEEILKPVGIDLILDMVGGDYVAKNIRLLRTNGRLVFINTMNGTQSDGVDFSLVMRNRLTITGSTLRNRDTDFKSKLAQEIREKVWPVIESVHFKPVIFKTFKLEEVTAAHELMESSGHIGKIMLVV